jgi:hypothetical protein
MNTTIQNFFNSTLFRVGIIKYATKIVEGNPLQDSISNQTVTIVGYKDFRKRAVMKCPCGCGDTLNLSLMRNTEPHWHLKIDNLGRLTLSPSVWKTDGCRSHFYLIKSNVVWV